MSDTLSQYSVQVNDRTLVANCIPALKVQARWLLNTVSAFAGQGKGLADGVTIQVGWSLITLKQTENVLLLCEPDFAGNPLTTVVPDVTRTLLVLADQRTVLRKLGLGAEGVPVKFTDKIVIERDCLADARLYMQRAAPTPDDSGWFIGRAVDAPIKEYAAIAVYDLLGRRPALMQMLLLPAEYMAVFDGDTAEAVLDDKGANVWTAQEKPMDYTQLKSARAILAEVAANDGQYTWYNILRRVDRQDVEKNPPTSDVLLDLTTRGLLRTDPPGDANSATYFITQSGRDLLARA